MSWICLCMTEVYDQVDLYEEQLREIAAKHLRGISFSIDWKEPIFECKKGEMLIFSLSDGPAQENCEMLLLPDGWYVNGRTNWQPFPQRMVVLHEIASMLLERMHRVEFYIGLSGTQPDEYVTRSVQQSGLVEELCETVGREGGEAGVHLVVLP